MTWKGCFPPNYVANISLCQADETIHADDPKKYRHFAVDDLKEIIYFCDRNLYGEGMSCFANNREVDEGNTWIGKFIVPIASGFSRTNFIPWPTEGGTPRFPGRNFVALKKRRTNRLKSLFMVFLKREIFFRNIPKTSSLMDPDKFILCAMVAACKDVYFKKDTGLGDVEDQI